MKNLKFSIIIPVYNSEKFLKRCVDSILKQTYSNLEIILVDDGSVDMSSKICDDYSLKDGRVKVFHKENGGVSSARNYGIEVSTGDYISFVDSDDYIDSNMYELLAKKINEENSDVVICNIYFENERHESIFDYNHPNFNFKKNDYPTNSFFIKSISGYVWNKVFSRKLIFNIDGSFVRFNNDISMAEDDLFNYDIFNKNKKINYSYINDKLYHYVLNINGVSNNKFNLKKLTYFDSRIKEIEILDLNGIDNNFLMADYVINCIRTKIIVKKLKIQINDKYLEILKKCKEFRKEISLKKLPFNFRIKYIIATCFPIIYRIKLKNSNN